MAAMCFCELLAVVLLVALPVDLLEQKAAACTPKCVIIKVCSSRILTCRKQTDNLTILEEVDCTRIGNIFSIGVSTAFKVQRLDPELIRTLTAEGGETIIFGTAVRRLSRYTFHLVPERTLLTLVFNSHYLRSIENRSVEMYNLNLVFYNNPDRVPYKSLKKKINLRSERRCDSRRSPCLCRYFYRFGTQDMETFSVFLNETSDAVCRQLYSPNCSQQSCLIPERSRYTKELNDLKMKKVEIDDYCSPSTATAASLLVLVLNLCTALLYI